jgi:hypothetical protein
MVSGTKEKNSTSSLTKTLTALTPKIDDDETVTGLPPVRSAVFLIDETPLLLGDKQ